MSEWQSEHADDPGMIELEELLAAISGIPVGNLDHVAELTLEEVTE
jgi:hypothetical protein